MLLSSGAYLLGWVIDGIIAAMRFNRQSQSCTAGSRLFLHRDVFDSFLNALGQKVKALKLGDPLDETRSLYGPQSRPWRRHSASS
jgi:acyl-CoA reductase-like NAD-dependent aldehyde dehydrogenase